jgi:hypothetical protein
MITHRHALRRWSQVRWIWVRFALTVVPVLSGVAAAQPIYHNKHNPSESCFEYLLAAASCALAGGLFHAWLQKDRSGPKDRR